jgi:LssY C-terminus
MAQFRSWWRSLKEIECRAPVPFRAGGRGLRGLRNLPVIAVLLATPGFALKVPAGTEVFLRLKTKVASNASKIKDPVDAIVIQPVAVDGQFLIPAGAGVHGVVLEVKASNGPDERAALQIVFREAEFGGARIKLVSTVTEVDNARETVDSNGRIQGIVASESISARLDAGIAKVAERFGGLAGVLGAAKGIVLQETDANIVYEPGVELTIRLDQPLDLKSAAGSGFTLQSPPALAQLASAVTSHPFQTRAQSPPRPSDVTNIMFVGSQSQLEQAFAAAGWSSATANNSVSKFETFKAIAESRGYKEAPVSVLLLEDQPPDLVFQKMNNTFAQRHHLRIWRRPGTLHGQPMWVCAATHDIGIDFSSQDRTFIHKIDPQIDRERAKVVNDLLLTGMVKSLALVDRPAVPKESANATGDKLVTDGQMAVILF